MVLSKIFFSFFSLHCLLFLITAKWFKISSSGFLCSFPGQGGQLLKKSLCLQSCFQDDLYKRTVLPADKVRTWGLYFYYKDWFLLLIHNYYNCKYVVIHTYLSHYILCVSFGSVLLAIVHLVPQINVCKNMHTALFCVVCTLPVFIILGSRGISFEKIICVCHLDFKMAITWF